MGFTNGSSSLFSNARSSASASASVPLLVSTARTGVAEGTVVVAWGAESFVVASWLVAAEMRFCPATESWSRTGILPRNSSIPSATEL